MSVFDDLFPKRPALIGMVHLQALPGTPSDRGDWEATRRQASFEAQILVEAGVDGIILENMHDRPYLPRHVGHEIVASAAVVAAEIRAQAPGLPLGLQLLDGANTEALAVAHAASLDFIRAEALAYGHLADEGWLNADAGALLRYRRQIGAERVAIWTDLRKKHASHAATADLQLTELARGTVFNMADALILSGSATGQEADPSELEALRAAVPDTPLLIGSGITPDNVGRFATADAFIVGSSLKEGGDWKRAMSPDRVRRMAEAVGALRS